MTEAQEHDYVRRLKRKRTWGNIALHWIPFLFMFIAVVAGAVYAQHNADLREQDQRRNTVERCHVFKSAVQANRLTLLNLIDAAYQPVPIPDSATPAQVQQYTDFNARQLQRAQDLKAGVEDDPLPDCTKDA